MRRRKITSFWAIAVSFCFMFTSVAPAFASDSDLQEKQRENKAAQNETQAQIDSIKAQQAAIDSQISSLSSDAETAEKQVNEITLQIKDIENQVAALNKSIEELEQEIVERNEIIKERMIAIQESGGSQTYLEVIFGATSFGNFIERTTTISAIVQSDVELIEEQNAAIEELDVAKAELAAILEELNATKAVMEEEQRKLEEELNKQLATAEELEAQSDHFEAYQTSLEEQEANLKAQEAAAQTAKTGGVTVEGTEGFINPCEGYVSSGYGPRSGGFHDGIDIMNKATGTSTPIYATADGVVSRSYYSDSYGNCVMITHVTPSGQEITTVYAHLSERYVSDGQVVSQGQQIGTMGSTGDADAVHLHYEVYVGPWNSSHSNAVDPISNGYASY